jgi:hypothetical protein
MHAGEAAQPAASYGRTDALAVRGDAGVHVAIGALQGLLLGMALAEVRRHETHQTQACNLRVRA